MKKKIIKAGFAGSGFAAKFHYDALQSVYDAEIEITGAYSPTKEHLEDFTGPRNLKAFGSLSELIENCDIIHICTPPVTHEPIIIEALQQDKHVIVEKPFTGYFGDGSKNFNGDTFSKEAGAKEAMASVRRMLEAEKDSRGVIMYAENWVYAPAIQKEREVIEKTGAQILWQQAQQSHSGSHSLAYGQWKLSGGGSLIGKGCHPLTGALYMKYVEGKAVSGKPIRPKTVSARTHAITRMENFRNEGHLKDTYQDVEDYAMVHIVFEDGTVADVVSSELTQGGTKNYLEVHANNHRTICNMTPNDAMQTYNPVDENFKDIYVVEKTGTKQGWSNISPDEGWFNGYRHEMQAFYQSAVLGVPVESNSSLAADVIATIYSAYVSDERNGAEVSVDLNM